MSTGSFPSKAVHSLMPGTFAPLRQNGAMMSPRPSLSAMSPHSSVSGFWWPLKITTLAAPKSLPLVSFGTTSRRS